MNWNEILTEPVRLSVFFGWMLIIWFLESGFPMAEIRKRKVLPNLLLLASVLILNLTFASVMLLVSDWTIQHRFGLFNWLGSGWQVQLVGGVLLLDFWGAWLVHLILHKVPWLWKFHSIHHSDTMVDVSTAFRQHPVESLVRISFLIIGIFLLGLPVWVALVYQTISAFFAQLEHSNLKINSRLDRILQTVFVTPNMHKIHHSVDQPETDSNYANIFSIWDRIFSTFKRRDTYQYINYGLDYLPDASRLTFWDLLKIPFIRKIADETSKGHNLSLKHETMAENIGKSTVKN